MDWHDCIGNLICRWLLQTIPRNKFPRDCLFLFGNPDLFRHSVIEGILKNIERKGAFYFGFYKNHTVSFVTPKLGAPAISIYLEALAKTSTKNIIALGFAGGLREGQKVGEYFLPLTAVGKDGTTQCYFSKSVSTSLDNALQHNLRKKFENQNFIVHSGSIISIDTLTIENSAMIHNSREQGFDAIDMETGCFAALCHHLKLQCGALHILTDNAYTQEIDTGGIVRKAFHDSLRIVFETFIEL